jgi:hypothetical protein
MLNLSGAYQATGSCWRRNREDRQCKRSDDQPMHLLDLRNYGFSNSLYRSLFASRHLRVFTLIHRSWHRQRAPRFPTD